MGEGDSPRNLWQRWSKHRQGGADRSAGEVLYQTGQNQRRALFPSHRSEILPSTAERSSDEESGERRNFGGGGGSVVLPFWRNGALVGTDSAGGGGRTDDGGGASDAP